ncbi:MAG: ribulose-phosphate 3-epimerase [Spirochaetales bacterium]|uniref:Ribulose-phosphate 3-epimerase n=1 Tax=Candidatus Thalassospirochaeta sargassi TaxID=3119039 RepID=A0AAJ1IH07_9SPIO|nr:ribulose-phosphate 3-epimerase [Spirochaetales bacterium]
MIELCGSILAANHVHISRDLKLAEDCGISRFHVDVCDGHYTPHIAFSDQTIKDLRYETSSVLEAHLAVHNMPAIAETFLVSSVDILTIQYESCELPSRLMKKIRRDGVSPGISFIPATRFEDMEFFLDEADFINILGVDPGIGGQDFNPKILKKIEMTADYISRNNLETQISVDGGVNTKTMRSIIDAGADILTFGSGIFSGNIQDNIENIRRMIKE